MALVSSESDAVKTSTLRERHEVRRLSSGKMSGSSGGSAKAAKSGGSGLSAPRCEESSFASKAAKSSKSPSSKSPSSKAPGGKMGSGKMSSSSSSGKMSTRRFLADLEDYERDLRTTGKMSGSGGKMSSGGSAKAAKSSSSSGGACANCGVSKDSCIDNEPLASEVTVECGDIITDYRILKTSLTCTTNGIIVDGGVLECTGDGDNVIINDGTTSSNGCGIRLLNGGTAINCDVTGFNSGICMEGDGNNKVIGGDLYNNQYGIVTGRDSVLGATEHNGCYTAECVDIFRTESDGIRVMHNGTMNIINVKLIETSLGTGFTGGSANPSYGAIRLWPDAGYVLDANLEDVSIQLPNGQGIYIPTPRGGSVTAVDFYKSNTVYGGRGNIANLNGIYVEGANTGTALTNYGNLKVQQMGIAFNVNADSTSVLMLMPGSDSFLCASDSGVDLDLNSANSVVDESGVGGLRCDNGDAGSFCFQQNGLATSACGLATTADTAALSCSEGGGPSSLSSKAPGGSKAPKSSKTPKSPKSPDVATNSGKMSSGGKMSRRGLV